MSGFDRRTFLGLTGGAAAAGVIGSLGLPRAFAQATRSGTAQSDPNAASDGRILVVIDLQGGNDALNTFVPQSGIYRDARPTLAIPENDLLTFQGLDYGVHPAMASLQPLWDRGQMTAFYGAGLIGQGRSHFVAQDAWRTARPGEPAHSGWLGRWLEMTPPAQEAPLRAIALGQSTLAAQGEQGRPVAVQSVEGFKLTPPRGHASVTEAVLAMGNPQQAGLLGEAQVAIPKTVNAVDLLQTLISEIEVGENDDPDAHDSLFKAVQAIIQGNAGTQIFYITINGFDTHALQGPRHAELLQLVADGVSGLYEALDQSGHAEQTLTLVVSEFGRRVAENGSAGTDHGQGGLSFMFGPPVQSSQVIGTPNLKRLKDGDLRITIDARTMYDAALRWLGASDDDVTEVLGRQWKNPRILA